MNSLLERVQAGERQTCLADTAEDERTLALLEWDRITHQIASFCLNREASEQIRQRRPYRQREPLQLWWDLTDELRPDGDAGRWPPLVDISTGWKLLDPSTAGQFTGPELVHLAGLAEDLDALRTYLCRARAPFPLWGEAAGELATFAGLATEIRRVVDRDGRLKDTASPLLKRLRRACAALETTVRREAESIMRAAQHRGWTTESEVTLRDDRYCLPLRAGSRRKVEGIVHARSTSGSTLFVEPAAVVHLHNELIELRFETAAEERRLLQELSRAVAAMAENLVEACRFLLVVDQVRAGMLWSKQYQGRRPRLTEGGKLRIVAARHPLLLQYGPGGWLAETTDAEHGTGDSPTRQPVVPLDLEMPEDKRVVVLSGPNAGGKSVALKTVGVCFLLAQSGWDVPAREDTELPLIGSLYVDLGDEQSIEKSLSSFSAHLGHLIRFLAQADDRTLVLCDEIGAGTDPQEGTALAFTVLEELAAKGALVLASTHYGLLKAAVHDHPAMLNAAMDFDDESLQPLFTLRLGVPGSSHAFDIAARWGLPRNLLARARSRVGEARFQIEQLLGELGRRARDVAAAEAELQRSLNNQREKQRRLDEIVSQWESQRAELLADTRQRGEELLRNGRRVIEKAVREIRSRGGDDLVIRRARDSLTALGKRLPTPAPCSAEVPSLNPGTRIQIPHLGMTGQVVEVRGEKVVAEAEGMRLTVSRDAVIAADEVLERDDTGRSPGRDASWRWHQLPPEVHHEIDLRGRRAEEAWQQLDQLIDRALPAGLKEILVIHGVGTGRLRAYLHEHLAADPRLESFHEAEQRRGGFGATVIVLADS